MKKLISSLWFLLIILLILLGGEIPLPILITLLVLAFAYPIFREFRKNTEYDERQIQISRFSSHIAMYLFAGLVLFVMIYKYIAKNLPLDTDPEFYMLLLVPLTVKMLINVFQNYEPYKAVRFICYLFGGGWMLFSIFDEGFSIGFIIQSLPFILLVLTGLGAKRYPVIGGTVLLIIGLATLVLFVGFANLNIYVKVIMFTLVPFPFMLGGLALIIKKLRKETEYIL